MVSALRQVQFFRVLETAQTHIADDTMLFNIEIHSFPQCLRKKVRITCFKLEDRARACCALCAVWTLVLRHLTGSTDDLVKTRETVMMAAGVEFNVFFRVCQAVAISARLLVSDLDFRSTKS